MQLYIIYKQMQLYSKHTATEQLSVSIILCQGIAGQECNTVVSAAPARAPCCHLATLDCAVHAVLQLLEVLREQLEAAIKAQQQLKAHLAKMAAAGQGAAAQQRALQAALPNAPQLSDGRRIIELLVPLAAKPGFKAALLEHKVVGMLAKYLHKLATRSKEAPECHPVTGLVLQLLAALCNPDVSLSPNVPR